MKTFLVPFILLSCWLSFATAAEPSEPLSIVEQQLAPASNPLVTHDLSPLGMYYAADWVVKSVMITLLLCSLLSWTVFTIKQLQLRAATKRNRELLEILEQSDGLQLAQPKLNDLNNPELCIPRAAEDELERLKNASAEGLKERLMLRLTQQQAQLTREMSSLTGILATIGSVGPFIGLFGTVWGIMNAFIGIAKAKSTTLVVVAPGIAEALMATAIGLVAAIPAVVMYNYFTRVIGRYKAQVNDIASHTLVLVSRDLDQATTAKTTLKKAG